MTKRLSFTAIKLVIIGSDRREATILSCPYEDSVQFPFQFCDQQFVDICNNKFILPTSLQHLLCSLSEKV